MGIFKKLREIDKKRAEKYQIEHNTKFKNKYEAKAAERRLNNEKRLVEIKDKEQERIAEKQKQKDEKMAIVEAKGKELGDVAISYIGGYDDQSRYNSKLRFYENQVEYSSFGQPVKGLVMPATDIASIEVGGQQQINSRISVTRMATLGIFSLAAPKRTNIKDTTVTIGLKDGRQVLFHTKLLTEFEVHDKLANAISYFHSMQAKQTSTTSSNSNVADELTKLAKLKQQGILTQEEFDSKKKQLLGL